VVEAAPLIERAYASGRVDELFYGDWNEAQYDLGLKERPPTKERFRTLPTPTRSTLGSANILAYKPLKKSPSSKKAKTKMIKASKKANRRKK